MFDTSLNELERDATGRCKGECRNRVLEGEKERQVAINREADISPRDYPHVEFADTRRMQPGAFGAMHKWI